MAHTRWIRRTRMLRFTKISALLLMFLLCQIREVVGYSVTTSQTELDDGNVIYHEPSEDYDAELHDNVIQDYEMDESEDEEDEGGEGDPEPMSAGRKSLRHRARHSRMGDSYHSSRDARELRGKGKGNSRVFSRSFLDPDIEPKPFVNCIPVPPNLSRSSKAGVGSKGKGRHRRSKSKGMGMGKGKGKGSSGRDLEGKGKGSAGSGGESGKDNTNHVRDRSHLPYCPISTTPPTFVPSFTPLPTVTPFPSVTPFPTFTPFPTELVRSNSPTRSASPSVSFSPSTNPSLSSSPSSRTSSGPTARSVASRLAYGFFAGTTIRQPTTPEINGLVVQTNAFWNSILRTAYPNSYVANSATMVNIIQTFLPTSNLPVILDFDLQAKFSTNSANTPTSAQIFAVMSAASLATYIQSYVWNAQPTGTIFFDTQRVSYAARGGTVR